jgi:hypothetical protein
VKGMIEHFYLRYPTTIHGCIEEDGVAGVIEEYIH